MSFYPKGRKKYSQRGFTLLLAALVASIVLALGASIFEIAQKEVTLSSLGRDSQFAFYVADTAAECALYWDVRCNYFATSTSAINPNCNNPTPTCDTQPLDAESGRSGDFPSDYTMTSAQMNLFEDASPGAGYCAQVAVSKCNGTFSASGVCTTDPSSNAVRTVIHADGYSVDCASVLNSPRSLQRSVELHY